MGLQLRLRTEIGALCKQAPAEIQRVSVVPILEINDCVLPPSREKSVIDRLFSISLLMKSQIGALCRQAPTEKQRVPGVPIWNNDRAPVSPCPTDSSIIFHRSYLVF